MAGHFETSGEDIRPMLRRQIDSCSAVLQIVGDAYGAEPPNPDETFGRVSYTQYEALYAKCRGRKVYYLIAQGDMPRDTTPATIDILREDTEVGRADVEERRRLQSEYRSSVQSTEHIFYPVQSHPETELSVRRLKQEIDKLRRRFQSWMVGVSVALVLLVGGVLVLNRGLWQQGAKIDETQKALQQQTDELKKLTAAVDDPKRIREQLVRTIQRVYDAAIAEAEEIKDWRRRDEAKQMASEGRDQNLSRVDGFLKSIEDVLHSGQASAEYLEMTRIFTEQGAEEAIAYIASRKDELFAKFDREQDDNRKMNLLPILESVRKEVLLGRYEAARETCNQLLGRDPNWSDAIHEQFWIITELGDRAVRYESISAAHRLYVKADELAVRLTRLSPPHELAQRDVSISHDRLGNVGLQMGQPQDALAHYESGLKIREKLIRGDPLDTQAQRDLAISHDNLGDVLLRIGQAEDALAHYESGLKISEKLAQGDPHDAPAQRDLSVSHDKLGNVLLRIGQPQDALAHYESGLKIREKLVQVEPLDAQAQRDLSISHDKLGDVLLRIGQAEDALARYESGLKIRETLVQGDPLDAQAQRDLAISHENLGDVLLQIGQAEDALAHYESELKISEKLAQGDPRDAGAQRNLSVSHSKLGDVLLQISQAEDALAYYESGLKIREKQAELDPRDAQALRDLSVSHNKLGDVQLRMHKPQDALAQYESGLKISEKLAQGDPLDAQAQRDLSISHDNLGDVLLQMGQPQEALAHYESGLKIREQLAQGDPRNSRAQRDLSISHYNLGNVLLQMGLLQVALAHFESDLKITEKLAQVDTHDAQAQRDFMLSNYKLGKVYRELMDVVNAKARFRAGIETLDRMIATGQNVEQCRQHKKDLEAELAKCDPESKQE